MSLSYIKVYAMRLLLLAALRYDVMINCVGYMCIVRLMSVPILVCYVCLYLSCVICVPKPFVFCCTVAVLRGSLSLSVVAFVADCSKAHYIVSSATSVTNCHVRIVSSIIISVIIRV